jgi:hypothetical protein
MNIQPIETEYFGFSFRSRLEARWAVFYELIGVKWDYEPEGYNLDGVLYLPDFHIERVGWIEIKPVEPTKEETEKAERLCKATKESVYTFFGSVNGSSGFDGGDYAHEFYYQKDFNQAHWDHCRFWCECPKCGRLGIEFSGYVDRLGCKCTVVSRNFQSDRLLAAAQAARCMSFRRGPDEHLRKYEAARGLMEIRDIFTAA